jgi:hypothetical protein
MRPISYPIVYQVKSNINSIEVHPQLSNNGHPVDGALVNLVERGGPKMEILISLECNMQNLVLLTIFGHFYFKLLSIMSTKVSESKLFPLKRNACEAHLGQLGDHKGMCTCDYL